MGSTGIDRRQRGCLIVAIIAFAAWAIGLGFFAFATAEKPRPAGLAAPD